MIIESRNENGNSFCPGRHHIHFTESVAISDERGNPHDNAMPKFIPDSSSCILGHSNEVSFASGFFLEGGQNSQNAKLYVKEST